MLSALLLSGHSYPALDQATQLAHQRSSPLGPLVLKRTPLTTLTPTTDRDRTVSRRSEPSSRDAFMGEQPNPWDLLQPQDAPSRHRGASWGWSRSQGLGCSPMKASRELGSERRETVRSLSVVGVRVVRGVRFSTRGPRGLDRW